MSSADASASDFPDRGPVVFAVTTATLVLATVFVSARLYCRKHLIRNVGLDDYFIAAAWVFGFGLSFSIDYAARHGLGRHDKNIDQEDYSSLRKSEYVFSVLYVSVLLGSYVAFFEYFSRRTSACLSSEGWL